jgi:transglutaminase-like putative cysteine protease
VLSTPGTRFPPAYPPTAPAIRQDYRVIHDFDELDRWVPMAYPPERLDMQGGTIRFDPSLTSAVASDPLQANERYSVVSRLVVPTPEQLDGVSFSDPTLYASYVTLPTNVPPVVDQLARRWTAAEPTPYRRVLAIQQHLTDAGAYEYSLDVDTDPSTNALVDFLMRSKRGFCQQFATAMAVLVRELGYPARVAVGFKQGRSDGQTFTVTTEDAHSWVEVYFPGYGWLPFEPTPHGTNPIAQPGTYLNPTVASPDGGTVSDGREQPGTSAGGLGECAPGRSGLPGQLCADLRQAQARGRRGSIGTVPLPDSAPQPEAPTYGVPLRVAAVVLFALVGLLLILIPIAKATLRRRLLHRRGDPRELVLRAYRVFDGEAADVGLGRRDGETLTEYRTRITAVVRFSDGHLERLTSLATRAAYAPEALSREDARRAAEEARTAIRDVRRTVGPVRRLVGVYRPRV